MKQVEVLSQQLVLPDAFRARYEIGAVLGQGGCGKAFRAQDRELSRPVAIKILVRADDAKQTERFLREGKLLARITDRHVVRVYDLDLVEGHPCLVMELVDGGTLRGLLAEGQPPLARALEIAWMMLKGLAACHDTGVVHRDLKPDNVLLTRDGVVKIADLGIARYAPACQSAFAVAATSWLWGEVGAGTKASRAALKEAIGHLAQMERDLPRSRLSLEAHRRLLEQSLAQFERR